MGRTRRRYKPLTSSTPQSSQPVAEGCENCRLVQKDTRHNDNNHSRGLRRHSSSTAISKDTELKTERVMKYLSDCESEADSAIDTASITSSSDNISVSFSELSSSISGIDDCCDSVTSRKSRVVEISLKELEKEETHTDLLALTEYVTGVSFQKFTTKDSCVECIESYKRALHIHQHNHMRMCGIDDEFFIDLSGLDVELHVEEFTNWSFGNTTIQTKEHGYYVSPQGATYYTDIPLADAELLTLPKQLMIPPSERAMFAGSHPPQRPWLPRGHPTRDYPNALFTVMNYNVLCDFYCSRQAYGYTPSWALHWDYRRRGILEEIRHYAADIICLQEVEKEQYDEFFRVEFEKDGYSGIYESKSRSKTMTEDTSKRVDGCAIFWRHSKFTLKAQTCIEYSRLAIENRKNCANMLNRVQNKDNIALCALLTTKEQAWDTNALPNENFIEREILVGNTHITWDPDYSDVKVLQTMMLMDGIKSFLEKEAPCSSKKPEGRLQSDVPMIMCGDFNSMPDSGVWNFLTKGKLDRKHDDFAGNYTADVLDKFSTNVDGDGHVSHAFDLSSAYKTSDMPFTNYTYDFKGILDYIFHTEQFNTLGVLGPLDSKWFTDNKVVGCPHPHIHSDHFSLLVEFELPDKVPGHAR